MKIKHIKEQRQKEVRRIRKRLREIYKEIFNLGYIQLDKPIRHGWFKEIVITQNVTRYKNESYILELYEMIEKIFWGRTKEEADKNWFQQTSKHLIYRDFPTISRKQFNKLSDKAQQLCTPFQYKNENKKLSIRFYIRIPKGAYRIKYTKAYVTHRKRIAPTLKSESDLLNYQLIKKGYYNIGRYPWENGWNEKSRNERLKTKKQLDTLKKYPIKDIMNNNIIWEKN